jgi:signal peptidase II
MAGTPPKLAQDGGRIPWVRFAIVLGLVALDLWSKQAVFDWIGPGTAARAGLPRDDCGHARYEILGEWLALMTTENPGMAFGRFGDWPRMLVYGRVAAVIFLAVALWRSRAFHRLIVGGLVLVLAGAVGNLWDNLFREPVEGRPFGKVRDFIDVYFPIWEWHFPTFNVADSCITVGAVLFLLHGFFVREEEEPAVPGGEPAPPAERGTT